MKYEIKLWFDFGGFCLWSMNDNAKKRYNYAIELQKLELSNQLESKLNELQREYETYLDMSNPTAPTSWSDEKKNKFLKRSLEVSQELQKELGSDFYIVNEVKKNIF